MATEPRVKPVIQALRIPASQQPRPPAPPAPEYLDAGGGWERTWLTLHRSWTEQVRRAAEGVALEHEATSIWVRPRLGQHGPGVEEQPLYRVYCEQDGQWRWILTLRWPALGSVSIAEFNPAFADAVAAYTPPAPVRPRRVTTRVDTSTWTLGATEWLINSNS